MTPTIEDVLKELYSLSRNLFLDDYDIKRGKASLYKTISKLQEWASLQTPSNEKYGWVKASERLPEKEGQYYVLMDNWKGTAYFNGNRFETGDWIKIERIQWLDESTPIPIQTPCVNQDELWAELIPVFLQLCADFEGHVSIRKKVTDELKKSYTITKNI
jgi:hypothetical protein